MGIFVIRNGASIPLHDHPGMHGIIKVLHGNIVINSYSRSFHNEEKMSEALINSNLTPWQRSQCFPAVKDPPVYSSMSSEPCVLTPAESNKQWCQFFVEMAFSDTSFMIIRRCKNIQKCSCLVNCNEFMNSASTFFKLETQVMA